MSDVGCIDGGWRVEAVGDWDGYRGHRSWREREENLVSALVVVHAEFGW